MRVAHFDCFSGISGDMTLGALIDAGVPADAIRAALDSLGLPITLEIEGVKRCGLAATKVTVHAPDQEDYRFLPDIEAIIARGSLTAHQRERALTMFRKLAAAEAASHGMPVERVHFHEVGALDSIADIVGTAVGLDLLGVGQFSSGPVAVGSGTVKCAHGIMPVPTPATAHLLTGIPIAASTAKGELTTPTGAAILATVVTSFSPTPEMIVERIGCGAGTRDPLEQPNILRLFVGTTLTTKATSPDTDQVVVLETNLDDCSAEVIGYCFERLFAAGALDVFTVPIMMKKQRPGMLLSVMTEPSKAHELEDILFRETGTFGVRSTTMSRQKLHREAITVTTPWGPVAAKRGRRNAGEVGRAHEIITPEYEDCARLARENGIPLRLIFQAVHTANVTGPASPK